MGRCIPWRYAYRSGDIAYILETKICATGSHGWRHGQGHSRMRTSGGCRSVIQRRRAPDGKEQPAFREASTFLSDVYTVLENEKLGPCASKLNRTAVGKKN